MTRFIFGNHGRGGSSGPLLNTWIPLPLLGGNMIMLVENPYPEYELVMYPRRGLAHLGLGRLRRPSV